MQTISIPNQYIVISVGLVLSFGFLRGVLGGIIDYRLNRSAYKKRKKEEKFRDWFLYTRFRDVIPKFYLLFYFGICLLHSLMLIFCSLSILVDKIQMLSSALTKFLWYFDAAWIILIGVVFWQVKPGFKYNRWISKSKKQ